MAAPMKKFVSGLSFIKQRILLQNLRKRAIDFGNVNVFIFIFLAQSCGEDKMFTDPCIVTWPFARLAKGHRETLHGVSLFRETL